MTINLTNREICDIRLALLCIAQSIEAELNDPETAEDRRQICISSAKKWWNLREKVIEQHKAQLEKEV